MQSEIPDRVVVSVVVKSRAEEADGWKLELDVPKFRSKYPVKVTRVAKAMADQLAPRAEPYTVALLRERPVKEGGSHFWDYYWGLEGLASQAEVAAVKVVEATEVPGDRADGRDRRYIRAQALTQAVAVIGVAGTEVKANLQDAVSNVLFVADKFYAWLIREEDASIAPAASAPALTEMTNSEAVVAWAKGAGYADKRAMAAVPGVTEAMKGGVYATAMKLLEKAKRGATA